MFRNLFASAKPTAAQLAKAGLVALTTQAEMQECLENGKPLRTFNGSAFPELVNGVYGSKDWNVKPTPTPTPAPAFSLPAVQEGWTRAAVDLFSETTLSLIWDSAYNGQSEAAKPGIFLTSHLVLKGDGWMRLEAYPDPANALSSWEATQAIAEAVNWWCGAGTQTKKQFSPPLTVTWICKWDTYPGVTPIDLMMAEGWDSEIDMIEADVSVKSAPVTSYTVTLNTTQGKKKVQFTVDTEIDLSQEHIWQLRWLPTGTTLWIVDNPSEPIQLMSDAKDPLPISFAQFFAPQIQTGDPDNPASEDPTITADNPITMYLGAIAFDVPSEA